MKSEPVSRAFARENQPPGEQARLIPIVSAKPGVAVRVILLGEVFEGFWLHWVDGRTRPCIIPRELCQGCQIKLGRRWKAFCPAYSPGQNRLVIAEITAEAARRLPIVMSGRESLAGREIVIERLGSNKTGPCRARLEARLHNTKAIGTFNLLGALARIWGLDPSLFNEGKEVTNE